MRSALALCLSAVWLLAQGAEALESCSATSGDGMQSCSINCDSGTPVCLSSQTTASCTCGNGAIASRLEITGAADAVSTIQIDTFDETCAALPCTPQQVHSIQVGTGVGMTALDFAEAAETAFLASYGPVCHFSRSDAVLSLTCPDFFAKYRICDAGPGECADDFVAGTGTSGDLGVDRVGLHFQTVPPVSVPSLGVGGEALLASAVLLAGLSGLARRRRR
jgi:hypothetical protein